MFATVQGAKQKLLSKLKVIPQNALQKWSEDWNKCQQKCVTQVGIGLKYVSDGGYYKG